MPQTQIAQPAGPAMSVRSFPLPYGVVRAEALASDEATQRAILAEQDAAAQRVIDEAQPPILTLVKPCTHPENRFSVRRTISSTFDDHATEIGQCMDCTQWLRIVSYKTSDVVEITPLSEREMDALAQLEDRYRRADGWES